MNQSGSNFLFSQQRNDNRELTKAKPWTVEPLQAKIESLVEDTMKLFSQEH